jgi:hypothetical protein
MILSSTFKVGDSEYTVLFNARARFVYEELAGKSIRESDLWRPGNTTETELAWVLTAGLEGHRVRTKSRANPWTVAEVVDQVLDDASLAERITIANECAKSVASAFDVVIEADSGKAPTPEGSGGSTSCEPPHASD